MEPMTTPICFSYMEQGEGNLYIVHYYCNSTNYYFFFPELSFSHDFRYAPLLFSSVTK